jgi:hypothetical protein
MKSTQVFTLSPIPSPLLDLSAKRNECQIAIFCEDRKPGKGQLCMI